MGSVPEEEMMRQEHREIERVDLDQPLCHSQSLSLRPCNNAVKVYFKVFFTFILLFEWPGFL